MKAIQLFKRFGKKPWSTSLAVRTAIIACAATLMIPLLSSAQSDTIQTNVPALKDVYANDFTIGCLLSYRNIGFTTDPPVANQSQVVTPNGGYLIKFHMNCMSPGNNMKPQYTVDIANSALAYTAVAAGQARDSVETHPIISFNGDIIAQLNWAKRQGFRFRGHTLVWHSQTPTQFFRSGYQTNGPYLTKDKMIQRMDFYIHEIVRLIHQSWPGMLVAIDVVNEAIDDNTGSVRTSGNEWYSVFGDSTYIMTAFQLARTYTTQFGETQIKLYYNDYSTETPNKANGIVRLLTPIYQAGFLDGIGMQEHNSLSAPTAQSFVDSYNKFYPVCSEMSVTELDVATGSASPNAATLSSQANQYGMLFKCFVERSLKSGRGKIANVSKDGLNDAYTFQTNQASSLWDAQNKCKPAFYAVASIGANYNSLDSLIRYASSMTQGTYTSVSWSNFTAALSAARTARDQNYSVTLSADAGIAKGKDDLVAAINGLSRTVSSVRGTIPLEFALSQNYPNPFNPTTNIELRIASFGFVSLRIYDALGREVSTLVNDVRPAGVYTVRWDASSLPSGVYYYRLQAGTSVETKQMVLMK